LGIGTSASYYIDNKRYTNIKNTDLYFDSLDNNTLSFYEQLDLSLEDQMYEEIMLGLRKTSGVNIKNFKNKFNIDIFDYCII
jgi:oxygen-independent coproporphyrinogen-3 oxidase